MISDLHLSFEENNTEKSHPIRVIRSRHCFPLPILPIQNQNKLPIQNLRKSSDFTVSKTAMAQEHSPKELALRNRYKPSVLQAVSNFNFSLNLKFPSVPVV